MSKASRLLRHIEEASNSTDHDSFLQDTQRTNTYSGVYNEIAGNQDYSVRELGNSKIALHVINNKAHKQYALIGTGDSPDRKKEWHLIKDYTGGKNPTGKIWRYKNNQNSTEEWVDFSQITTPDGKKQIESITNFLKSNVDETGKPQTKSDDASYKSDIKNLTDAINKQGSSKKDLILALTGQTINEADNENNHTFNFGKWFLAKNIKNQDLFVVTKDKERFYVVGKEGNSNWQIASPANGGDMDDYQIYDWDNNSMIKADKEIKQKYKNITNLVRNMRFKKDFFKDTNPENKLDKAGRSVGGYAGMLLGGPLGAYVGKKAGEWATNKVRKML